MAFIFSCLILSNRATLIFFHLTVHIMGHNKYIYCTQGGTSSSGSCISTLDNWKHIKPVQSHAALLPHSVVWQPCLNLLQTYVSGKSSVHQCHLAVGCWACHIFVSFKHWLTWVVMCRLGFWGLRLRKSEAQAAGPAKPKPRPARPVFLAVAKRHAVL